MAREWTLPETKALVEEHIALKEEEKVEVRTASEHWNKVAKRLREKGYNRSHKSCNKRWYRLEQYEVQIFSFNMEEGNKKNFWDLTKAERLEFRDKWPQLPSGDGIDRDIFDTLKRLSQRCEKKDVVNEAMDKEVILVGAPEAENMRPTQPPAQPQPTTLPATPRPPATPFSHPMVTDPDRAEPQKQPKSMWPGPNDSIQQPSVEALDGFKLQARELRRRRAAELRRNNRTVPYSNTYSTFMKATTPQTETTTATPFGSALPSLSDFTNESAVTKPPFQLKRPNPFANQQYAPTESSFQSKKGGAPGMPLLESVNAHVPLLQPQDGRSIMAELGSLEQQLQVMLGAPGTLQHCERQLHKNNNNNSNNPDHLDPQFRRAVADQGPSAAATSALGAAAGRLGVQLGAIVQLLQAKQVTEQEFRDKMLVFVECMVASLHAMAQATARANG